MYSINRKRLIKTFVDLAKISSPSWREGEVIDYITGILKPLKIKFKKYSCGDSYNLLVKIQGEKNSAPVLFSCHTDTVTPCENIKPRVTEDRITSDGTTILGADDKAAVAAFIEAIRVLKEQEIPHGDIEFLFSCAEETGLNGVKGFDLSRLSAKYAFVFDSEGKIGKVILKAPYHITVEASITGKAAHAGIEPEKGISAILAASMMISRIPHGRIDDETTINVGTIQGGQATNIVADNTEFVLEVRSIDKKKMNSVTSEIEKTIREVAKYHRAKLKIKKTLEYSGFSIKKDDKVIRILDGAIRNIRLKPVYEISGGGSDTNIINRAGIKAVNLSTGMRKVHTKDEYILIKDLVDGSALVLSIIESV